MKISLRTLAGIRAATVMPICAALTMAVGLGMSTPASAAFIVNISQDGSNVVADGAGALDLAALTFLFSQEGDPQVWPADAGLVVGTGTIDVYGAVSGPSNFGAGGLTFASAGTGDAVGEYFDGELAVPTGYVSGTALSDTATWDNTTIAALGLTPGTYTYTWGSGRTADDFVINVAPVPEPSSLPMLLAGLGMIGGAFHFGRKKLKSI